MAEGNSLRNVPMRLSNTNVLTTEFNNIWDNFGNEMKMMQEEMNRFQEAMFSRAFASPHGFTTPLIQDGKDGRRQLKLRFDVSQYAPEEIEVMTENNYLLVHAKHEDNDGTKRVYREYNQQFMLPQGVAPDAVSSNLSADGVLTVEAPIPQLPEVQKHLAVRR